MPPLKPPRAIQVDWSHPLARGLTGCWLFAEGTNCNIISTSQHATDGGEWIHAVGTWSQNDGRVYVNGELEQSESSSGGNLKFVNDSQPVGIGGTYEGGTYYYPWNGKIDYVLVYNRVLSVEQIKWLYREPFAMFENSIRPTLIGVGGAIVSLAGSVSATSAALAQLESTCNPPQAEQNWFSDALFNGMTARAFKLGSTLSLGWFWLRTTGCSVLYRGPNMEQVDFDNVLAVAGPSSSEISPPGYLRHDINSTYFYVIRRFNNCGYQEKTLAAAAKVSIGGDGELQDPQPNKVFTSRIEQAGCNGIRIIWFYCPLEQESPPVRFNIYYDNRTDRIDYQTPLASISYQGRKFYSYRSGALTAGKYLFAVRAEDANGEEGNSSALLSVQLNNTSLDPALILSADCL